MAIPRTQLTRMNAVQGHHPSSSNLRLCKHVQPSMLDSFSSLVKKPSKLRVCAAIKKQNSSEEIGEFFSIYKPFNLRNEEEDAVLIQSLFGESDNSSQFSKDDYSIVVVQKFISKVKPEFKANEQVKIDASKIILQPQITRIVDVPARPILDMKAFLAMTYESYKAKYQEAKKIPERPVNLAHTQPSLSAKLKKPDFSLKSITGNYLDKSQASSNKSSFIDGSSANETVEEMIAAPPRSLGPRQNSFSGLYSLRSYSKANKLTATTMSSLGGFSRGDDYSAR